MAAAADRLTIPDLADKVVLITGASTGIGAAVARAFAAQRAKIGLHYHSSVEAARHLAQEIEASGNEVFLVQGDLSDSEAVEQVVERTCRHFDRLNGLINNAGLMLGRVPYSEVSDAHYDAVMNLNARSVVVACRCAIPRLRKNGGFIINTSSVAARNGAGSGAGLYGSAKAFVSNLTRGLAKELIGDRIRVNAVAPGFIATPFHDRYSTPEQVRAAIQTIPLGRAGRAEDCVGAYLFLASELLSGYLIGQIIEVNGGQLMP
jgi:3-oxoacyl-[acyl-carrier protein] reductase